MRCPGAPRSSKTSPGPERRAPPSARSGRTSEKNETRAGIPPPEGGEAGVGHRSTPRARGNFLMSEWQGAEYQDVSQLQRQLADESLAALVLDGTERVLDVGCGDGRITAAIA